MNSIIPNKGFASKERENLKRKKVCFYCSMFPRNPLMGDHVLLWKEQDIWGEKRNMD